MFVRMSVIVLLIIAVLIGIEVSYFLDVIEIVHVGVAVSGILFAEYLLFGLTRDAGRGAPEPEPQGGEEVAGDI